MKPSGPDQNGDQAGVGSLRAVAEELRQESDKLQQLASQLEASQEALADLQKECDLYRRAVYAWAAEQFHQRLGELPDKDLETLIAETDAQPLEAFLDDLLESRS